ncbi:MAG: riboflavin biosynthesis protein RibF [Bacteroidota bacterium]|nr:riboflavin biosynthesis protein RibF [Bacteroidota bacterium]
MQVHTSMDQLPEIASPVVTVGSFDGVHVGHRVIIGRLNDLAAQVGGSSVLITFHPHPRKVLYPDTAGKDLKLINSQPEKIMLLEDIGLDHLIIMEFTPDFARTTSDEFVEHYLVEKLHAHTIVVGFNHYFGHNREGSFASLYEARERFGFRVEEIPEQEIQNETVSSTKIRKALKEGNIQRANAYLEHHYMIRANMEAMPEMEAIYGKPCFKIPVVDPLKLIPPGGAYAASFLCKGQYEKALVYMGEGPILLFPINQDISLLNDEGLVRFHLRLAPSGDPDLTRLLDAVRELIY